MWAIKQQSPSLFRPLFCLYLSLFSLHSLFLPLFFRGFEFGVCLSRHSSRAQALSEAQLGLPVWPMASVAASILHWLLLAAAQPNRTNHRPPFSPPPERRWETGGTHTHTLAHNQMSRIFQVSSSGKPKRRWKESKEGRRIKKKEKILS